MKKITCLMLACCAIVLHTFAQEDALRQKADTFMAKHRTEWDDLELRLSDSTMRRRFQEHPFFRALNVFLKDNGDQYTALRTARFRQYAPPPAALKAFDWQTGSGMEDLEQEIGLLSVAFLRSFDPVLPAQVVTSILSTGIAAMNNLPTDEFMAYYQKRDIFGFQLYAAPVTEDEWQVWCADRTYAMTFHFDLRTGKLGSLKFAQVHPIQWPASVIKPMDDAASLMAEEMRLTWDQYRSYNPERETAYRQQRNTVVDSFYEKNQERFINVRATRLQLYVKDAPALTGYKELTTPDMPVLRNTDTVYPAHAFIYPEQWEVHIGNAANGYFELGPNDLRKRTSAAGLYGVQHYTHKTTGDQWEIWAVSDAQAIYYVWDLRTGKVNNIRYWVK
ncbi:hypothetical protein F0L74_09075 [Chitinophaga agrisoli]|uniref:Uncharacterized protein n=1 Tax=Chitinophaga agrisoli TaxID=2607653 RepID=A0A5B2VTW7_9BACT|nr:hypothetical protein [Chitinophaga agrisoli]KAA2242671.1 hypothetical protein F0L74_09075 [Chitinophaga agrisoli]